MNGKAIALDTNQAIAVLNAHGDSSTWIATFAEVWIPVPVLGELHFGMLNSRDAEQNIQRLGQFESNVLILPTTRETALFYARTRLLLKKAGRPIPENDLWIAAVCLENTLPLATSDEHFERIDGLQVIRRAPAA